MSEVAPQLSSPPTIEAQQTIIEQAQQEQQVSFLSQHRDETGSINFNELIGKSLTQSAIAIEGIRGWISSKREGWAGSRMERMDHKTSLYQDLGSLATTGSRSPNSSTATGRPAMPRSFAERFLDRRIDSKGLRKSFADTEAYHAQKVFGSQTSIDRGLGPSRFFGLVGERRRGRRDLSPAQLASRPELAGKRAVNKEALRGNITARERRQKNTEIDAVPLNYGARTHRMASREQARQNKKFGRVAGQPVKSRWRSLRRADAIADIKRHHRNANKHQERQQRLRDRLS